MHDDGRRTSVSNTVLRPPVAFLQYYLLRGNWLNGFPGFVWSLLAAGYKTVKYLKLYEYQVKTPGPPKEPSGR